ncbi:MAG TPA: hypothetical protein VK935_07190 [Actinomycetospora sp.]|nr:hypothetical protein [Actinomycetospora sp.]
MDLATEVRRRPGLEWRLVEQGEDVALHFHRKNVTVPARVRESLVFVTGIEGDFSPADLVGLLDPDSALRLTRRLLAEGFLTRSRRDQADLSTEESRAPCS